MSNPFVSGSCGGEACRICGKPAEHKVEETIFHDDPTGWQEISVLGQTHRMQTRHPLTAYICHEHFVMIMGPYAKRPGE